MGKEIERKFLLKQNCWKSLAKPIKYRQGYLSKDKERTIRVRTIGNKGFLTIKGIAVGFSRAEFEYEIPIMDAEEMLSTLCKPLIIEKNRYKIHFSGLTWEVDEFLGENEGLIVAEVELESENQEIQFPEWIGEEVTNDPRFFNSSLSTNPYKNWK
jgi:CYTH domain-containing protein